jgi:hypothetical protein
MERSSLIAIAVVVGVIVLLFVGSFCQYRSCFPGHSISSPFLPDGH